MHEATDILNVQVRETIYRLAAVTFGYPLEETLEALQQGRLQAAFSEAWQALGGAPWPDLPVSSGLQELQVGYMVTFIHGKRGKPRVPLVASAYGDLAGQTPSSYLLNVQAFYSHFGLKAALDDEGLQDEPDHVVAMLEFCALLCYLEKRALEQNKDPSPYQRAQRDFLARYLVPHLRSMRTAYGKESQLGLDPNLEYLLQTLPDWAASQLDELEHRVGRYSADSSVIATSAAVSQPMWD